MIETPPDHGHLDFLDGLRGLLALWVFAYHATTLTGWNTRLVPPGALAVDAFMLLSGFLMTYNFTLREPREPLASAHAILSFYVKRYFRVAPLYYVLLAVSLALSTHYVGWVHDVWSRFPPPWIDPAHIAVPFAAQHDVVVTLAHVSFIFGLFPATASDNALPDWSLSLEMQFYLLIPFLHLLARRIGWVWVALGAIAVQLVVLHYIGLYSSPGAWGTWPQPALLPMRITCFLAGSLIALYATGSRRPIMIVMILLLLLVNRSAVFFAVSLIIFYLALRDGPLPALAHRGRRLLGSPLGKWLGAVSYAVYLVHFLVLWPVAAFLARQPGFAGHAPSLRFLMLMALAAAIVLPLAWALHLTAERYGIALGRRLLRRRAAADGAPMTMSGSVRG